MSAIRFGKWVAIPEPHSPTMHELWYRLEAMGRFVIEDHRISPSRWRGKYIVILYRDEEKSTMMAVEDSLYKCLYELYRRICAEEKRERELKHVTTGKA